MKIKYTYQSNKKNIIINVDQEDYDFLIDLDRNDYNNTHKHHRHSYSLDTCVYEGDDFAVEDTALEELFVGENDEQKLKSAISQLKPEQQNLIRAIYFEGIPVSEYARQEGVSQPAISQRLATAIKNLKKLF